MLYRKKLAFTSYMKINIIKLIRVMLHKNLQIKIILDILTQI